MMMPAKMQANLTTKLPVRPKWSKNAKGENVRPIMDNKIDITPKRNKIYPTTAQVLLFILISD